MKINDVVLVKFPFTDLEQTKQRPALILKVVPYSRQLNLFVIAMMTSQIDLPQIEGDFELKDWKNSGLLHPTRVRLAKIATLEESLIIKKLGTLHKTDAKQFRKEFAGLFTDLLD